MAAVDYPLLAEQIAALAREDGWYVPLLSNTAALIMQTLPDLNWAGFYLVRDGRLVLGPFQGLPACIHLVSGKGVCGTAWARDEALLVPDVHAFAGHIACDGRSRSELVVPLHAGGGVVGVLDLDSPTVGRFTGSDRDGLVQCVQVLEQFLQF